MPDAIYLPENMPESCGDLRPGGLHHLADSGQGLNLRVVMDTQLAWLVAFALPKMHPFDARPPLQVADQPIHASISIAVDLGQQDLDIQP